MQGTTWARELARKLLRSDGQRLAHSEGVGRRAAQISAHLPEALREDVVAAAYLHDVGYSPVAAWTGFHALDGATYLAERGFGSIAGLVAHHSASQVEAEVRGLAGKLGQFDVPDPVAVDALTYCDVTTGPSGDRVTLEERLRDIHDRYGPDEPVRVSVERAESELRAAVSRVEARLASLR